LDQERQILFLYPPFFLLASLLLGLYFDPHHSITQTLPAAGLASGISGLLGLIAGGSVVVLASGFLIGAVSVLFLRVTFLLLGKRHYEAGVSAEALKRIWEQTGRHEPLNKSDALYAVATFDHEVLPKTIRDWVGRRWSAFNISIHSCTALALAPTFGRLLSISVGTAWLSVTLVAIILLALNGYFAWHDTMAMIEFQSHRHFRTAETNDRENSGA